uniref:Uncharacterized protein n=1 Tax=Tetranychus urticae TaxID=32264 RepID=T1L1I0_TETUR
MFMLLQEKSIRDAVRNLNHQQHGGSSKDQHYSLNHRYPPTISSSLADKSLPDEFKANLNYLISPKTPFNEIDKRQDEVVMDIPLEVQY